MSLILTNISCKSIHLDLHKNDVTTITVVVKVLWFVFNQLLSCDRSGETSKLYFIGVQ